jgi:hypothetical protein
MTCGPPFARSQFPDLIHDDPGTRALVAATSEWRKCMADTVLVELIVPKELVADIERLENRTLPSEAIQDNELKFGFLEVAAILLVIERGLRITKLAIEIYKLLKASNNPNAKAAIRSPIGGTSVEISAADSEEGVRQKVNKAYPDK